MNGKLGFRWKRTMHDYGWTLWEGHRVTEIDFLDCATEADLKKLLPQDVINMILKEYSPDDAGNWFKAHPELFELLKNPKAKKRPKKIKIDLTDPHSWMSDPEADFGGVEKEEDEICGY